MAKLIEYTATSDQIKALNNALKFSNNGVFLRLKNGNHKIIKSHLYAYDFTHYLIRDPHPYADLIDIWRLTGCEVWTKFSYEYVGFLYKELSEDTLTRLNEDSVIVKTTKPNWNIPGAEYRLTPFED